MPFKSGHSNSLEAELSYRNILWWVGKQNLTKFILANCCNKRGMVLMATSNLIFTQPVWGGVQINKRGGGERYNWDQAKMWSKYTLNVSAPSFGFGVWPAKMVWFWILHILSNRIEAKRVNLCTSFVGIFRWHCGKMKNFIMLLGDRVPRKAVRTGHKESDQMEMVTV